MGIMLALLLVTNGVQQLRIANWRADFNAEHSKLITAKASLDICSANQETLKAAIKSQGEAFTAMQAEQRRRDAAARAAAEAALKKIEVTPIPPGADAMNAWMRGLYGH